jgi:hypothetical protein
MDGYISTVELPSAPWQVAAQAEALVWPALASPVGLAEIHLQRGGVDRPVVGQRGQRGLRERSGGNDYRWQGRIRQEREAWRMLKLRMDRAGRPPASPDYQRRFRTVNAAVQRNAGGGRAGRAALHTILHMSLLIERAQYHLSPTTCGSCRPTRAVKHFAGAPTPASPGITR